MSDASVRKVPVKVHSSPAAPPPTSGYPTEIQFWFQRPGGHVYILCRDGWKKWAKGTAVKDVCGC
jgi:hypothetical protein